MSLVTGESLSHYGSVYDADGRQIVVVSGSSALSAWTQANGTNPAANTEVSEVVPAGKRWELKAVSVALVQGATLCPLLLV